MHSRMTELSRLIWLSDRRLTMEKKNYISPEIETFKIACDIITFSETEEWEGPVIAAGEPEN